MTDQSLCLRLARLQTLYRNRPINDILDEVIDRRWRINRMCQLREKDELSELDRIELSVLVRYFFDYLSGNLYIVGVPDYIPPDPVLDEPLAELETATVVAAYSDAPSPTGLDVGNREEVITSGCV